MPKTAVEINSKLPNVGTTIFTVMSKLANEHGAVNLSQGFPNFPVDPVLLELVSKHMQLGHNQYAPMPGVIELRQAISNKVERLYGSTYSPETEVTVTPGATEAIYTAITTVIQPGDEVILFAPAYDCYAPAIELNGGVPVYVNLNKEDYSIPWEKVNQAVNGKTRMIIINSPHNPTGAVIQAEDLEALDSITQDSQIVVLSDEVYEHIIFDSQQHQSCALNKNLRERSFIVASFGKTFHATGWKMGYILGPEKLMNEFRKVHQFNVFSCHSPSQFALAEYISNAENYLGLPAFYQAKRDLFLQELSGSRFAFKPSSGTYFQLLEYKNISSKKDTELAVDWTKEKGIASIPVSVFYPDQTDNQVLRFCFAKDDETIRRAAQILKQF